MKGKDKCKILKELRAQIAAANDIEWVTENCTHKGECRGTCPKCEAEVVMLERALERRRALGKTVALTGLAAGMIATTTACSEFDQWQVRDGDTLANQATETAGTRQTTEERIGVEVDGDLVTAGEMFIEDEEMTVTEKFGVQDNGIDGEIFEPVYYYTDFIIRDSRTFEATTDVLFTGVMDGDGKIYSSRWIPEGAHFAVIGETEEYWLISYEDGYYYIWKDKLDKCAVEVQYITADESDDSAVRNGD